MRAVRTVLFCTLVVVGLTFAGRSRVTAQTALAVDPRLLAPLRWRSIGPASTGGRIDDIAVARVSGLPDAIYVATASGGIFKSTNQGTTWAPVFDGVDAMMSVGDIAVAPSNVSIVWAGTGEANNRQSSSWGDGVYKSTDAGRTWTAAGLRNTRHIGRIVIDPVNSEIVYVAAAGHLWGPNDERGVFKTIDGGHTWEKVLFIDRNTGATDLAIDPQNPQILYAATYQRQRAAWGFNGGGPGSGVFRTRDGGATWTRLTDGLPAGDKGRIGLDVSRIAAHTVYAVVEAAGRDSGVYRSSNGGDSWEQITTLNPRPMYYSQIRLDPRDPRRVYLLGSNRGLYISDDAGATFRDVFSTIHSEDHALWIDPDDTNHLIVGGDGGVSISWDRGGSWLFRDNLSIGQFLRDQRRYAGPVHDLRRASGQRPLVRPQCHPQPQRHLESRHAQHRQRRRVLRAHRSEGSADGRRRIAGRPGESREPRDPRTATHCSAAAAASAARRARALELERTNRDVDLGSQSSLHGIEHRVSVG